MSNAAARTIAAALQAPRPGVSSAQSLAPEPVSLGLELSETLYKPLSFFRLNPANERFRALKSAQYMEDMEADIRENGIVEDVLAMTDGLLLAGETRFLIAERLGLAKLPCKLVLSPLSAEEQEKRLILDNVLRFEIPSVARVEALYHIGFYKRPNAECMAALGASIRQVKREKAEARAAEKLAAEAGREAPAPQDFARVRETENAKRRASTPARKVDALTLESALHDLDTRGGQYAESADFIRKVVGL
jgi:hypothetical protein